MDTTPYGCLSTYDRRLNGREQHIQLCALEQGPRNQYATVLLFKASYAPAEPRAGSPDGAKRSANTTELIEQLMDRACEDPMNQRIPKPCIVTALLLEDYVVLCRSSVLQGLVLDESLCSN